MWNCCGECKRTYFMINQRWFKSVSSSNKQLPDPDLSHHMVLLGRTELKQYKGKKSWLQRKYQAVPRPSSILHGRLGASLLALKYRVCPINTARVSFGFVLFLSWFIHELLFYSGIHYNDVIMSTMASQITSLTIVYPSVYSGANLRKHQSSASLAFVRGNHRGPVNSPHKGPVTRKMFPFHDVIMFFMVASVSLG